MTNGTGPRWRRRTEPAFETDEGDWLSGLRPSAEDDDDDAFDRPRPEPSTLSYPPAPEPSWREPAPPEPSWREPAPPEPSWREPAAREPSVREPSVREPAAREPSARGPSPNASPWLDASARESAPGPMPDEEPIFRPWDSAPPAEPPPILQEQPMLRYMQQSRPRPNTSSYGRSYGRRRLSTDAHGADHAPPAAAPWQRNPGDEPSGRFTPAPRDPYTSGEEYLPEIDHSQRNGQYAGPTPPSVRPRRPYDSGELPRSDPPDWGAGGPGAPLGPPGRDSGGMRAVRPDTSGRLPRVSPGEPPTSNGRGDPNNGGMRAVRPDTTGGQARVTSGGQPRFSPPPADEPTTPGGGMRAVRPDTGEHPRISGSMATDARRGRSESTARASTTGGYARRPKADQPPDPGERASRLTTITIAGALVVLVVLGVAGYFFLVRNDKSGKSTANNAGAQSSARPGPRDISNRQVDPAPLTEAEVFPGPQLTGKQQYQVLKVQTSPDCGVAAVDDLARMLGENGCNQIVRGTLKSADGVYLITAGIFNLRDTQAALAAHENIKPTIDAQKGRFTGLLAGQGTEALVRAPMILGWHARGHYLAYCIIARADGKGFDNGDKRPDDIQADILTTHLRDTVVGGRTQNASGGPAPSAKPSA